jgi:hypothetical protein
MGAHAAAPSLRPCDRVMKRERRRRFVGMHVMCYDAVPSCSHSHGFLGHHDHSPKHKSIKHGSAQNNMNRTNTV